MASPSFVNHNPDALVAQFSRTIEARQRSEAEGEDYDRLQSDLGKERDRRAQEREDEIRRLEAQFASMRPKDVATFDKAKRELLQSMKSFQRLVPEHMRTTSLPTSWAEVEFAVSEVQAQWDTKIKETHVGRAKEWIRKMGNGMQNHSMALNMLPSSSEYVSLVAGAVAMIIKASANYTKIVESFAKGIVDINDTVSMVQKSQTFQTPALQQLAMRLYARIFSYLSKFMEWYTDRSRSRFLRSFNENIYNTFQDDLAEIKQISSLLCQQIQLHMSADVRISKLLSEDMSGNIKYLIKLHEDEEKQSRVRDRAYADFLQAMLHRQFQKSKDEIKECLQSMITEYEEKVRREITGAAITTLLRRQASGEMLLGTTLSHGPTARSLEGEDVVGQVDCGSTGMSVEQIRQRGTDVKFKSRHLEDYFEWERIHPFRETPWPLFANAAFVMRLRSFTTTMESQILYAHSQYQPEGSNILRQSAAGYVSLAREAGVPVVSYFCRLSHQAPPGSRTRESEELIASLYSMIRQLIDLLPAELSWSAPALDETRFTSLDGDLRTWEQAMSLFVDVERCVNLPLLLFVIDGLNLVEDDFERNTSRELEQLIACLKLLVDSSTNGDYIVKVLFTTAGLSGSLCRALDEGDIVSCDVSSPGEPRRPHRASQMILY